MGGAGFGALSIRCLEDPRRGRHEPALTLGALKPGLKIGLSELTIGREIVSLGAKDSRR